MGGLGWDARVPGQRLHPRPIAEAGARGGAQATTYEFRACFGVGPGTCDYSCLRCLPCAGAPPFPTPPPSAPPPGWGYLALHARRELLEHRSV